MLMIELFSGNGDISALFRSYGWDALSVDYDPKQKADLHLDVYDLPYEFLKMADFIWASPDCTSYSLASRGIHRGKGGVPVSDFALQCDRENASLVIDLIRCGVPFIIENPRGHMRNMPWIKNVPYRTTVYYSAYGFPYAKPTDLFSSFPLVGLDERKICTHVHLDHLKSYDNFNGRCKMPGGLIQDIYRNVEGVMKT